MTLIPHELEQWKWDSQLLLLIVFIFQLMVCESRGNLVHKWSTNLGIQNYHCFYKHTMKTEKISNLLLRAWTRHYPCFYL